MQGSGHQQFLVPWGPFQPENMNDGARISCADDEAGKASLVISNVDTGDVINHSRPSACRGLITYSIADLRPTRVAFTILEPGRPLWRQLEISDMVAKLPDGFYCLKLEPLCAWWCWGTVEDIFGAEDRIPRVMYRTRIPPLQLTYLDEIMLRVRSGRCVFDI